MTRTRMINVCMGLIYCVLLTLFILVNTYDGGRWPIVPLH